MVRKDNGENCVCAEDELDCFTDYIQPTFNISEISDKPPSVLEQNIFKAEDVVFREFINSVTSPTFVYGR